MRLKLETGLHQFLFFEAVICSLLNIVVSLPFTLFSMFGKENHKDS